MKVVVQVFSQL